MASGHRLIAVLGAVALVLGSCGGAPSADRGAPVADECAPSPLPVVAPQAALTAKDLALPVDRFPLCGYQVTSDEATGTNGSSRMFRPTDPAKANFAYAVVQTFVLPAGDSGAAFVARQKPETWSWGDATPTISRLAAEVVGDAAAAYQAWFGQDRYARYIYVSGHDGYGFVIFLQPSRSGVDFLVTLPRLLALARAELTFADQLTVAAGSMGTPCNVQYDGTWTGEATYTYQKESQVPGRTVPTFGGTVTFTFRLRCVSLTADAISLRVTQAASSHGYFGATQLVDVQGTATLPRSTPLATARPSDPYTIAIIFPNGATAGFLLVSVPSERADRIAMAPGGNVMDRLMGWAAGNATTSPATTFPFDPVLGAAVVVTDKGWSFTKQTGSR